MEKGGVILSSANQDFQFELQETLYFDKGDEVLELIGVSLNPEVEIQPYDTYVSIRGEIELRGEYMRDEQRIDETDHLTLDDLDARRFVHQVESKEDNIAEFYHRFPVDISIPDYRIENMDDIRIEIINFDYELPANSKLQLTAVAEIQGIKAEVDLWREQETKEMEVDSEQGEMPDSFTFEVERAENEIETERVEEEVIEEAESVKEVETEETGEIEETEEIERIEEVIETNEERETEEVTENELTIRAKEEEEVEEEGEPAEVVNDVSYLTDIFRHEESESYTKMRICIAQEEDTIDSIAERFQVSALQLIKQNKLDDDFDISEGQLLYIPKK